ncbi:hypothetical protein SDC9_124418 [bioreactor metagenome]|uniref:Uncharacterized protein n=1 Tax=bioreactor metagenome TaxID=1076179 RepID=A0A645CKF3_9ZZZZ
MHAHVHQRPAARGALLLAPVAGDIRIPAGELRKAGNDRANLSRLNRLAHRHHVRAKAHHQPRRNQNAARVAVVQHFLSFRAGHGERFFN